MPRCAPVAASTAAAMPAPTAVAPRPRRPHEGRPRTHDGRPLPAPAREVAAGPLEEPPAVVSIGVGLHGVTGALDVFRLPGPVAAAPVPVRRRAHRRRSAARHPAGPCEPRPAGRGGALPGPGEPRRGERRPGGPQAVPVIQDAGAGPPALSELLLRGRCGGSRSSPSPPARAPGCTPRRRPPSPSSSPTWPGRCARPRSRGPPGSPTSTSSGCSAGRPAARSRRTSGAARWSGPGICCAIRSGPVPRAGAGVLVLVEGMARLTPAAPRRQAADPGERVGADHRPWSVLTLSPGGSAAN